MDRPSRRRQFSLRTMLFTMSVIALLILPTRFALRWILVNLHRPAVTIPDGGVIIIGGVVIRPDGTRRYPNPTQGQSQSLYDKTANGTGSEQANAKAIISVSPRMIIQEEVDEVDIWPRRKD